MIIFGETNLERMVKQYIAHYHHERNHQGLDNRLILPEPLSETGTIQCRERMGGSLKYYYRDAA